MNYPKEFEELIKRSAADNTFIGAGNPMGKILLIGQECAINKHKHKDLYQYEIVEHIDSWQANIAENKSQADIADSIAPKDYNPLYPYKGKMFIKDTKKTNKRVEAITATWYHYQWLYDIICGQKEKRTQQDRVNFFEDCFMTELSAVTAPSGREVNEKEREQSIKQRRSLFKDKFFQSFPIVIVAAGKYPTNEKYEFSMEEIFDVKWDAPTIDIGNKFVNIHHNKDNTKLLIHTNQLSYISEALLNKIADKCKVFIKANHIQLKNGQDQ